MHFLQNLNIAFDTGRNNTEVYRTEAILCTIQLNTQTNTNE